jgi:hypothetical protein
MAFVPAALWNSKPFVAPKALYFLVIDFPAFCAGVVIRGPTPPSWMVDVAQVRRQANCSLTHRTRRS